MNHNNQQNSTKQYQQRYNPINKPNNPINKPNNPINQPNNPINKHNNPINQLENDITINNNIKTAILDYLYNKIEVSDHKYIIIKNISDVYQLKNTKHYMAANTCGINSLLIFIKKDDNYYSYLIDRRSISYNRQSLNISKVRFIEIKLPVSIKIYDGTILDGILIDSMNSKMEFMITDAFMLNGKSLITMDYKTKIYMIEETIKSFSHEKNSYSNINIYISRPFEINQFNTLFSEYISKNTTKYNIKGITFYPNVSGTKLIYIFDKGDDKLRNELCNNTYKHDINKHEDIKSTDNNTNLKIVYKYELVNIEDNKLVECNLEMHKTDIPDVFKLFGIFFSNNVYIKKRIGIAYIPSYKLSLMCKSHFMNRNVIIFTCKLDVNKNKWIPIDEASVQKIDIINKHPRFKIIEEEVYDAEDTFGDDDNTGEQQKGVSASQGL
jgi:hypothetical protein